MWDDIDRDEKIRLIKEYVLMGYSTTRIAGEIGGCTRNAVIGLAHRAKIPLMASPARTVRNPGPPAPRPKRLPKVKRQAGRRSRPQKEKVEIVKPEFKLPHQMPEIETVDDVGVDDAATLQFLMGRQGVSLLELNEHTCKWPVGDPLQEDFYFCGQQSKATGPYCEFHSRRAYHQVDTTMKRSQYRG